MTGTVEEAATKRLKCLSKSLVNPLLKALGTIFKDGKDGRSRAGHQGGGDPGLCLQTVFENGKDEVFGKYRRFEIVHQLDGTVRLGKSCFVFFRLRPSPIGPGR